MRLAHNRLAAIDAWRDSSNAIRLTLSAARFTRPVYSNVQADAPVALTNKATGSVLTERTMSRSVPFLRNRQWCSLH